MREWLIVGALLASSATAAGAQLRTFDVVISGRQCGHSDLVPNDGTTDCTYIVGQGLEFVISSIGRPDVSISVLKATPGVATDYRLVFSLHDRCVLVTPGTSAVKAAILAHEKLDSVFVSPRNGGVYATLRACQAAKSVRAI